MRIMKEIPISQICIDRIPLKLKSLQYAQDMRKGDLFPPIHVKVLPQGGFRILDGRHRWTAAKLIGKETILAKWGTWPGTYHPGED